MISEREKELLYDIVDIDEHRLEKYTDEEIIDNMQIFLRFENFRETKRAADLLCKLDDAQLKDLGTIFNLPVCLGFEDALELMNRGLNISKSDFTEKYLFAFGYEKEYLVKYKHLLDFNTIIYKKLWYVNNRSKNITDNFMEVCYDELKEVTTRTLLDALGVNLGEKCPTWEMGLLMDKLVKISNRQFKDNEIIKVLLEAITGLQYTNPDFYTKIFNYFDDNFIMDNIDIFNPIQLNYANRLTEEILEVFISKSKVWERYKVGFGYDNPIPQLSECFIYDHYEDLNMLHIYITQKNILNAYRHFSDVNIDFKSNVDLVIIYLHNPHLTEEELDWLRYAIEDVDFNELSAKTKIDNTYSNCALKRLVELEEFKNGKN